MCECMQDSCSNKIEDSDSKLTFDDFCKDHSSEECWRCWNFPQIEIKNEVKILNPKYCTLYPKRAAKKLKELIPKYDECKTIYTKCDFKLEACVHNQLLKLEDIFKFYEKTFKKEIQYQSELIDPIWTLSVRYCLLTKASVCIKYYPEIISAPTERRALCEFQTLVEKLHRSNCRLRDLLNRIQTEIDELDRRATYLDMTVESTFLKGDGGQHRPFAYIREMITDVFNYFFIKYCELRTWAQLIDIADCAAIEDYKATLESSQDYDGFMIVRASKCTCRRARFVDCLKDHKPC